MSQVFVSSSTGAEVYVFSNDHCPPHVHARHRGDGWMARVGFSYLGDTVTLMSIAPTKNIPPRRVLNGLLDDVRAHLAHCRRAWWSTSQTACLMNQWVTVSARGKIEPCSASASGARQIANASYEASSGRVRVAFLDGTSLEVKP